MILLDNSVLRRYARPNPDENVLDYLTAHRSDPWGISAVVLYEFLSYYDSQATQRKRETQLMRTIDDVVAFDSDTAAEAASLESSLEGAGISLDAADLLIAATARQHNATFVTADKGDFDKPPIHELLDVALIEPAD